MAGPAHLLSLAGKEVQAADELLTVTYPLSRDPKALLGVMRHGCSAIELAAQALALHGGAGGHDAVGALASSGMQEAARAAQVHAEFSGLLRRHGEAPTAFARKDRLVVASQGFASVEDIGEREVAQGVRAVKEFVYKAGKHVMLGRAVAGDAQ